MIRLKVVKSRLSDVEQRLAQLELTKGSIAKNTYDSLKSRYQDDITLLSRQIKQMKADIEKASAEYDIQHSAVEKTLGELQQKNQENEILRQNGAISTPLYRSTKRNLSASMRRAESKLKMLNRRKANILKSADDGSARFTGGAFYNRESLGEKMREFFGFKSIAAAILIAAGIACFFFYQNRDMIMQTYFPEENVEGVISAKNGLYLRVSPAVDAPSMSLMPFESRVKVIKSDGTLRAPEFIMGSVGKWRKVYYQNMTGWAFDGFITYDKNLLTAKEMNGQVKTALRQWVSESNGVASVSFALFNDGSAALNVTDVPSSKNTVFTGTYAMTETEIIVQFDRRDYNYAVLFSQNQEDPFSQYSPPQVSDSIVRFPPNQNEFWIAQVRCSERKNIQ